MNVNKAKYENAILYLCEMSGGTIDGLTKLYKLLYFADFDRFVFNESMRSITGDEFKHMPGGPVPQSFNEVISVMVGRGDLQMNPIDIGLSHDMITFTAHKKANLEIFDKDDITVLEYDFAKYGHKTGSELSDITHGEPPYIATDPGEIIPLELGFYRNTPFNANN
jgi:uncharacterized phage-associated protein